MDLPEENRIRIITDPIRTRRVTTSITRVPSDTFLFPGSFTGFTSIFSATAGKSDYALQYSCQYYTPKHNAGKDKRPNPEHALFAFSGTFSGHFCLSVRKPVQLSVFV